MSENDTDADNPDNPEMSAPTPELDADPDPLFPGGTDAVESREEDTVPDPDTPDQPKSAQVEEQDVPDEIKEPEKQDADDGDDSSVETGNEEPAG